MEYSQRRRTRATIGNNKLCQDELRWTALGILKLTHLYFLPLETCHAYDIILFLLLYL